MEEEHGVMYTSVQKPTIEGADVVQTDTYDNVVLPVIDIKDAYCNRLKDLFEWTEPYCVEFTSTSDHSNGGGSRFVEIENQIKVFKIL